MSVVGQTAPRLIATLKQNDRKYRTFQRNPYTDPPRGYNEQFDASHPDSSNPKACQHYWTVQHSQTVLSQNHASQPQSPLLTPGPEGQSRVAYYCQNCRWHVDVIIKYNVEDSCPKKGFPLHHFVDFEQTDTESEYYQAKCSGCASILYVEYRWPRLEFKWINLLTDSTILRNRFELARQADPERANFKAAQPIEVLDALSTYIRDCLKPVDTHRPIPRRNRRFMVSFGEELDPLLLQMGFSLKGDEYWRLPRPGDPDPWGYGLRKQLEDYQEEIWTLMRMHVQPHTDKSKLRSFTQKPDKSDAEIQELLGTIEYDKARATRRAAFLTKDEEMCYAGLGALGDFSDEMLRFAFDRQVACDPSGMPFYFACFKTLAAKRNSEAMQMEAAILESEGYFAREDIAEAYRYFTIEPEDAHLMTDATVKGHFETRLASSGAWQHHEIRQKLRILALARNSKELQDAAANDMQNAAQALRFLEPSYDANMNLSNDQILSLATVLLSEKAGDASAQEQIKRAVQLVADERNSEHLRLWAATGDMPDAQDEDTLASAFRFYSINDRSNPIDDTTLDALRTNALTEYAGDTGQLALAIRYIEVLAKHFQQNAGVHAATVQEVADYQNPVGLRNIGNTCYLNCLLQYFFAIKPFREILENFDLNKQDLDEDCSPLNLGRVVVQINRQNVETAQDFAVQLAALFEQMTTDPGPNVSPTWSLASAALIAGDVVQEANRARRPTIVTTAASRPTSPEKPRPSDYRPLSPESTLVDDAASDVTLIGDAILTPESETDDDMKQDRVQVTDFMDEAAGDAPNVAKKGDTDQTVDSSCQNGDHARSDSMDLGPDGPIAPSRPPPVPPRPLATTVPVVDVAKTVRHATEDAALQQDVHEVITNVLFKMQCAIKAERIDERGERLTRIRELFFMEHVWTYPDKSMEDKVDVDSNLIFPMSAKPCNIYAALDMAFGLDTIPNLNNTAQVERYRTATKLPPMLQFYFQKQGYDKEKGSAFLLDHHIQLEDTIYMDRYMSPSDDKLASLREESRDLTRRLKTLIQSQEALSTNKPNLTSSDLLDRTWQFINEVGDDLSEEEADDLSGIKSDLKIAEEQVRVEIEHCNEMIARTESGRLALPFEAFNTKENAYKLFAVFIHRGTKNTGHYWIFLRDFTTNVWRKYNDETVTEVTDPASTIFNKMNHKEDGSPYLVVYVRDHEKEDLIETLHRKQPPPSSPVDAVMTETLEDEAMEDGELSMSPAPEHLPTTNGIDPSLLYHG